MSWSALSLLMGPPHSFSTARQRAVHCEKMRPTPSSNAGRASGGSWLRPITVPLRSSMGRYQMHRVMTASVRCVVTAG
jgi:hypothetical protein